MVDSPGLEERGAAALRLRGPAAGGVDGRAGGQGAVPRTEAAGKDIRRVWHLCFAMRFCWLAIVQCYACLLACYRAMRVQQLNGLC